MPATKLAVVQTTETTKPARKRATTRPAGEKQPSKREITRAANHKWAHAGIAVCVVLSAGLNGYANSMHAPQGMGVFAWMLGIVIPCLVFILARVGGTQYTMGAIKLAYFTASMGGGLLVLSVAHCAASLSMLTGMTTWMGYAMAVAIDGGLVACELETLRR